MYPNGQNSPNLACPGPPNCFFWVFFFISCSFVFVTYFVPLPCKLNGQTWSRLLFLLKYMVEKGLKTHQKRARNFFWAESEPKWSSKSGQRVKPSSYAKSSIFYA